MTDREEWVKKAMKTMGPMMDAEDKFIYACRIYDAGLAARQGDGEAVAWLLYADDGRLFGATVLPETVEQWQRSGRRLEPLIRPPVPAQGVPEVVIDMLEDYASALGNGDLDGAGHSATQSIYEVIDLLSTTPGNGWVRCEERRPDTQDADCEGMAWCEWEDWFKQRHVARMSIRDIGGNKSHIRWMPTGLNRPEPPKGGQK